MMLKLLMNTKYSDDYIILLDGNITLIEQETDATAIATEGNDKEIMTKKCLSDRNKTRTHNHSSHFG